MVINSSTHQKRMLAKNSSLLSKHAYKLAQNHPEHQLTPLQELAALTNQDAKKLSQLIASSWLPGGEDIKTAFNGGDTEAIVKMIKEKTDIDLQALFGDDVIVTINWESFLADIEEIYMGGEDFRTVVHFPYPERPSKDEVSDNDLQSWVNNTDSSIVVAPFPYIPLSAGG